MKTITSETFISVLQEQFPSFVPYWEAYVNYWGTDQGATMQIMPFSDYVVDTIKAQNVTEIKKVFEYIEFLICNGDESVQNAMTTSCLEYLLSKDPEEIQFSTFVQYLGESSISYCRAWDKFTGVKTKGLQN